eukprot:g6140.t1
MASALQACFTWKNVSENINDEGVPQNVKCIRRAEVCFNPESPIKEPLAPSDIFSYTFQYYIPWAFLFDYDIDFYRLMEALHVVAQKYLLLCGRLCEDETGRYFLEVGSFPKRKYDFPVVEMRAGMSMAEAVLRHGRITTKSADYPVHPDTLPFYLNSLDIEAIHKGQDPFLRVKLTHFSDGCCLAISVSHFLMDGMRFAELFRDISRAYCGKEVSIRDIKREYMMYKSFSNYFSEEEKAGCVIPKTMPTGREPLAIKQYSNESSSLEILYFSKKLVDDMKSKVSALIPQESFVSTANIMQALLWMLACEINNDCDEIKDSTKLNIVGTTSVIVAEPRLNGFNFIPKNYLGNAAFIVPLSAGEDMKSKSLLELLAALALQARQKQMEARVHRKQVYQFLASLYTPLESVSDQNHGAVSNLCKLPISAVDFGGGSARLLLCHVNLPIAASLSFVTSVFHTNDILLHLAVTKKQKAKMKASAVLRNCAPEVKYLFDDFGLKSLEKLMKGN